MINTIKKVRFIVLLIGILIFVAIASSCVFIRQMKLKKSLKNSCITSVNFPTKFKFKYDKWIFIKAKLNNSEAEREFMLDTGSPCTYCFRTKEEVNLKSKKLVRFGIFKMDYGSSQAEIEHISYDNLAYIVSDMAYCWKKNNSGYIGVNAMQNSIWEFNFQDTTITVSDTLIHFKNVEGASKIRFTPLSEQQTPVIKIVINNGDTITALLDTGNDKILQLNSKFDINKIHQSFSDCVQTSYYNINQMGENVKRDSIYEINYIKANSVHIGDLELKSSLLIHRPGYQGKNLIGLGLFKKFIVTIDWKHYCIYLKLIENSHDLLSKFSYGFKCDKTETGLKVTEIFKNSLVDMEGIKCGDEIIKLNNKTVAELDEKTINSVNNEDLYAPEITVQFKSKEIKLKKEKLFSK